MIRERKRIRKTPQGVWKCQAVARNSLRSRLAPYSKIRHIPLHKWLLAIHLLTSSKKGMSAHQLMRNLDIKQYKSAWFMAHRIRYALTGELPESLNGVLEADETYVGGKPRKSIPHATKPGERPKDRSVHYENKQAVFSILQRGGKVYSQHVERVTAENLTDVIKSVLCCGCSPNHRYRCSKRPEHGLETTLACQP